jgi:GNAT superfamily N-acetyltransferase
MSSSVRVAETFEDLVRLLPLAEEFYAASQFLKKFDAERFIATWTRLLSERTGVIFLLEQDGIVTGALGGVVYPEPYSGDLVATEFFWFVTESARGGRGGIQLYREFESWARERGAAEIRMVHLLDLMPAKVERFYKHCGFEPIEVHFVKGL